MHGSNCCSWPAYSFLRRQVNWYGIPISWRIFHSLLWFTHQKSKRVPEKHFLLLYGHWQWLECFLSCWTIWNLELGTCLRANVSAEHVSEICCLFYKIVLGNSLWSSGWDSALSLLWLSSIPGQGSKISQAAWRNQEKKIVLERISSANGVCTCTRGSSVTSKMAILLFLCSQRKWFNQQTAQF